MNKALAAQAAYLRQENKRFGTRLTSIDRSLWPRQADQGIEYLAVFRSCEFLVQVVRETETDQTRISVNRTTIDAKGEFRADISWEELQWLKGEAGFSDRQMVEVFPRDCDVVNIANMRHLFLLPSDFCIGWSRNNDAKKRAA